MKLAGLFAIFANAFDIFDVPSFTTAPPLFLSCVLLPLSPFFGSSTLLPVVFLFFSFPLFSFVFNFFFLLSWPLLSVSSSLSSSSSSSPLFNSLRFLFFCLLFSLLASCFPCLLPPSFFPCLLPEVCSLYPFPLGVAAAVSICFPFFMAGSDISSSSLSSSSSSEAPPCPFICFCCPTRFTFPT
uniref:Uncharacterized protein n=1 Tax=Cacopsylla melanoneura TaxID=428564 RepID=A0A8D9BAS2_9HEMI